ncbi:radical SAM protein, partial [Salmonella enterica]|nr:radical SAM protein [Salmonella enterica]
MNLKSVTADRISALQQIGVTHPRFGLQTFDSEWRDIFNLTEATDKIEESSALLTAAFDHVLCDLMYGMNGQDEEVIISDINKAIGLGLSNIDIYPINNVVTPAKLHKLIKKRTDNVTSAIRKLSMSLLIDSHMRQKGFMPHNGHGYVKVNKVSNEIVTNEYSFGYHEHVYGYADYDFIGFGVNAISSVRGYVITNETGREKYISAMNKNEYLCKVSQHDILLDEMKPIILRLPYHGEVDKNKVQMSKVPLGLRKKLDDLIDADLIQEDAFSLKLTKMGWLWYANIMFYLMPEIEQKILKKIVHEELKVPGRF